MARGSLAFEQLPTQADAALCRLGENLAIARKRRKQSLAAWAKRIQVSIPTLLKMEKGDPTVGIGVYATAIWLMGDTASLAEVASPANDTAALESEVQQAQLRGAPKKGQHGRG